MSRFPKALPRPTLTLGLTIAVLASIYGLDAARGGDGDDDPDRPPIVLEERGSPDTLCVFWTTQMHGQVEPCG